MPPVIGVKASDASAWTRHPGIGSAEHMAVLYEAGRLLALTLDLDVIYETLRALVQRTMDCVSLIVSRYTSEDNMIRCAYAWVEGATLDPATLPPLEAAPLGQGLQSHVIFTGESLIIGNVPAYYGTPAVQHFAHGDGHLSDEPEDDTTRSLMMVPLALDGQVVGVAQIQSYKFDAYTEDQLHLFEALVGQVAAASRNAILYTQAQAEIAERRRVEEENALLLDQLRRTAFQQRAFYRDVLASVTQGKLWLCTERHELPSAPVDPVAVLAIDSSEKLADLRRAVADAGRACSFSEERIYSLITAASEAAMNAFVHAGGGVATVDIVDDLVLVWIEDAGSGISLECLPRATLERGFSTASSLGHGFWLMLHSANRLYLLTRSTGTTLVLEQGPTEPPPGWLE